MKIPNPTGDDTLSSSARLRFAPLQKPLRYHRVNYNSPIGNFSSLLADWDASLVPSGEERGKTAVFAG